MRKHCQPWLLLVQYRRICVCVPVADLPAHQWGALAVHQAHLLSQHDASTANREILEHNDVLTGRIDSEYHMHAPRTHSQARALLFLH